jgi:hypothetical protein
MGQPAGRGLRVGPFVWFPEACGAGEARSPLWCQGPIVPLRFSPSFSVSNLRRFVWTNVPASSPGSETFRKEVWVGARHGEGVLGDFTQSSGVFSGERL